MMSFLSFFLNDHKLCERESVADVSGVKEF
jgi:hypothetical protein